MAHPFKAVKPQTKTFSLHAEERREDENSRRRKEKSRAKAEEVEK